jgi:hypothetical protein
MLTKRRNVTQNGKLVVVVVLVVLVLVLVVVVVVVGVVVRSSKEERNVILPLIVFTLLPTDMYITA